MGVFKNARPARPQPLGRAERTEEVREHGQGARTPLAPFCNTSQIDYLEISPTLGGLASSHGVDYEVFQGLYSEEHQSNTYRQSVTLLGIIIIFTDGVHGFIDPQQCGVMSIFLSDY
jgi:hypothetical protein